MGREDLAWIGLALVLLIGGLVLGQRLVDAKPDADGLTGTAEFRQWLWESRSLDLAVQASLILTGALAIAALLPREREPRDEASTGRQDKSP